MRPADALRENRTRNGRRGRRAVKPLSDAIHLNVLNNSYGRLYR
jgi:hypothetical protein